MKNYIISFSVATACKLVNFPLGEKKFFEWLRKKKYLQPNNEPYETYRKREWFVLKYKIINGKLIEVPVTRFLMPGIVAIEKIVYEEFYKCPPNDNKEIKQD